MRQLACLLTVGVLGLGAGACGGESDSESASVGNGDDTGSGTVASVPEREQRVDPDPSGRVAGDSAGGGANGDEPTFTPRPHDDSSGGSEQFRIPGGDNSVQEYGTEVGGSQFEQAAAALHNFLDARAQRAWAAACEYLEPDVVRSLEETAERAAGGDDCAGALEALTLPAAIPQFRQEARRADVGSLRAEGDRGFLLYRGPEGSTWAIPMVRDGGSWKVGGLAGLQLS